MARTRLALLILLAGALGFLFANSLDSSVYAQPQTSAQNQRLTITPVAFGVPSTRAAFVKDTKTGRCWLWLTGQGEAPALAPARDSACN